MSAIKTLLDKLEKFKNERTAFYFFDNALQSCNRWGYFAGLSILDPDFNVVNGRLIYLLIFNIIFIFVNVYSIITRNSESMIEMSISSVTVGMALQGLIKQHTFVKHHAEIKEITESGVSLYNELQEEKIKKIARDFAFNGWMFIMHFLRYAYISAVAIVILAPIVISFVFGNGKELPVELELPFIDKNTEVGYWINFSYILNAAVFELIALQASDGFYLILLLNGFTQLENIFFELEVLDDLIKDSNENSASRSSVIAEKLNSIIKLHQNYIR